MPLAGARGGGALCETPLDRLFQRLLKLALSFRIPETRPARQHQGHNMTSYAIGKVLQGEGVEGGGRRDKGVVFGLCDVSFASNAPCTCMVGTRVRVRRRTLKVR